MRHKTSVLSPKALQDSGIPFHMVVQRPGEFVITFPASYHAGKQVVVVVVVGGGVVVVVVVVVVTDADEDSQCHRI